MSQGAVVLQTKQNKQQPLVRDYRTALSEVATWSAYDFHVNFLLHAWS